MDYITFASAIIIAAVCILGVFSDFEDTTAQRFALAGGCIASVGIAYHVWRGNDLPGTIELFLWCLAVHCIEAARKFWKAKYANTVRPAA